VANGQQQYPGNNQAFAQGRGGFAANNQQMASTPFGPGYPARHPAMNQQQQQQQPGTVYPQAPYPHPGSTNQPVQMPTAAVPTDRRYAHHAETAFAGGGQPQFSQTRFPSETYPQYGYAPAGNMQPAVYGTTFPPGNPRGYAQPGSTVSPPANGQRGGYMNGIYPVMETHYGQPAFPPTQMHNSVQTSRMPVRLGACGPGNVAGRQPSSEQLGVIGSAGAQFNPSSQRPSQFDSGSQRMPQMEPTSQRPQIDPSSHRSAAVQQQARNGAEERHISGSSADDTLSQANISAPGSRSQATPQTSNPHIVKPPVLHATAAGN